MITTIAEVRALPVGSIIELNNGRWAQTAEDTHWTKTNTQAEALFFNVKGRCAIDEEDLPAKLVK